MNLGVICSGDQTSEILSRMRGVGVIHPTFTSYALDTKYSNFQQKSYRTRATAIECLKLWVLQLHEIIFC